VSSVAVTHRSRHFSLAIWACDAARGESHAVEFTDGHELIFVRRGAFALSCNGKEILVTPNEALLLRPGIEYTVRHPVGGGDDCTVVAISRDLAATLGDAFGRGGWPRAVPVDASLFRAQSALLSATAVGMASTLEADERLGGIVSAATANAAGAQAGPGSATASVKRRVAAARELIAAHFHESLPLAAIGDGVGLSPFHLSRAFRRETGTSMHRYQTRLRVRAALKRLAEGENDLTSLALDMGFSSHSHFTTSFGREFGVAPAALRSALTTPVPRDRAAQRDARSSQT
jgi:AraC-like DNA-binding protein